MRDGVNVCPRCAVQPALAQVPPTETDKFPIDAFSETELQRKIADLLTCYALAGGEGSLNPLGIGVSSSIKSAGAYTRNGGSNGPGNLPMRLSKGLWCFRDNILSEPPASATWINIAMGVGGTLNHELVHCAQGRYVHKIDDLMDAKPSSSSPDIDKIAFIKRTRSFPGGTTTAELLCAFGDYCKTYSIAIAENQWREMQAYYVELKGKVEKLYEATGAFQAIIASASASDKDEIKEELSNSLFNYRDKCKQLKTRFDNSIADALSSNAGSPEEQKIQEESSRLVD